MSLVLVLPPTFLRSGVGLPPQIRKWPDQLHQGIGRWFATNVVRRAPGTPGSRAGHGMSCQAVRLGAPTRHALQPVGSEPNDLLDAEATPKATSYLRLVVAFETKDNEIVDPVVRRILVDVVDLNGSPDHAADAAGPVRDEQNLGR